jgi:hypothetical protein
VIPKVKVPRQLGLLPVIPLLVPLAVTAEAPRPIFPAAFSVERSLREIGPAGAVEHETASVTDTYGDSYLVSVREGEDRVIVDFARREITDVAVSKGTYWVLSFSRMRELRERLARAEAPRDASSRKERTRAASAAVDAPRVRVEEVRDSSSSGREALASRAGVKHLRASAEGHAARVDVWVDPTLRLEKAALDALKSFETEVTGELDPEPGRPTLSALISAARESAQGAFALRTRRNLVSPEGTDTGLVLEENVTNVTALPAFPKKLLVLPETLKRVPSPLETMVAYAEDEAALRAGGVR